MTKNEINSLAKGYAESRMCEFGDMHPALRCEMPEMLERDFMTAILWLQRDYRIVRKRS